MSDSKVFMFPETGSSNGELMSVLAPLLSQRGVDPNVLLALNNRDNGFGGEGGWFMWIIFLFFLMGWGGNGYGGFGNRGGLSQGGADLAGLINNDNGRELLMSAIQGNGTAISQLASTLNCSIGNVQSAITGVMSQVQSVGNQVGMSGQQIINAIQSGNAQIANQLAQCCCNVQEAITRQGYENQIATVNQTNVLQNTMTQQGFENQLATLNQTNALLNAGSANTTAITAKLDAIQTQNLYDKIDALREKNSSLVAQINNEHQTAAIQQYQAQSLIPVNTALTDLSQRLAKIECATPPTFPMPYYPASGSYIPVNYGINLGAGYGLSTFGSGCNCGY